MSWSNKVWFNHERRARFQRLLRSGYHIDRGRVAPALEGLAFDMPWIFVGDTGPQCGVWNEVYWQEYKIIPRKCRESCWKVVIRPQTVAELFNLLLLMKQLHAIHGFTGKCGIDVRWYTFGRYAGFWYNDSYEEGLECYKITRHYLDEVVNEDFIYFHAFEAQAGKELVYLKKGCTEMQHPVYSGIPSCEWETHESVLEWDETEKRLDHIIERSIKVDMQPSWLHNSIKYLWVEYAHMTGDPTYRECEGEDPFAHSEDKYHRKSLEEVIAAKRPRDSKGRFVRTTPERKEKLKPEGG